MKAGDYVRTKDGYIAKLIEIRLYLEDGETIETEIYDFDKNIDGYNNGVDCEYAKEIIVKSSSNLIDLIEVGDYVNGKRIFNPNNISWLYEDTGDEVDEIKSIVTREMFESMEYKVGD